MRNSTCKLLRSLSLSRAGLASALVLLLLGASTPRLNAQSYNFNGLNDTGWTHYDFNSADSRYPPNTYSFPTNPAGPAGNYAYRIQVPVYTSDPNFYFYPRGGSYLTGANYGNVNDSTSGRVVVGADLIAWNTTWSDMEVGIAWDFATDNYSNPIAYLAGWGPGEQTLGIAKILFQLSPPTLIGLVAPLSTKLQTNHQYRIVASTHDGSTLLAKIFDLAQPNSPWQSAITTDSDLGNFGGTVGILGVDLVQITTDNTEGADSTWDNFSVSAPAFVDPSTNHTVAAFMPATVTDLTPPPAGVAGSPILSIGFLNRDTGVNTTADPSNWIQLYLDGVQIPNNQLTIDPNLVWKTHNNDLYGQAYGPPDPVATNFPGATVTYIMTNQFALGSRHTSAVVFEDDQTINGQNVLHTNTWWWTAGLPQPLNAALSVLGFATRTVVSYSLGDNTYANIDSGGIDNSIAAAQAVLANQYNVNLTSTNIAPTVNWGILGTEFGGTVTNFPGLCVPTVWANSFAVEAMAYLQLPAGSNVFWIAHDAAVGIYSGQSPTDTSVALFEDNHAGTNTFSWYVLTAGLYPIHIIYEQGSGAGNLVLASATGDGNEGTVVGAAGGIPAFYPVPANVPPVWQPSSWTNWNLMSSTVVKGLSNYINPVPTTLKSSASAPIPNAVPITAAGAPCDGNSASNALNQVVTGWSWAGSASGTNTIIFLAPTSATYYRLYGPGSTTILSCQKSSGNLVLTYRWQQSP